MWDKAFIADYTVIRFKSTVDSDCLLPKIHLSLRAQRTHHCAADVYGESRWFCVILWKLLQNYRMWNFCVIIIPMPMIVKKLPSNCPTIYDWHAITLKAVENILNTMMTLEHVSIKRFYSFCSCDSIWWHFFRVVGIFFFFFFTKSHISHILFELTIDCIVIK